jgi:hypothetical protein
MSPKSANVLSALVATGLLALATNADATVVFIFDETTPFDATGIGASATLTDDTEPIDVTMTTVDVIGADLTLASGGTSNLVNVFGNSIDSLGINSANIGNTEYANESRDFNPNEGWVFSFNVDVNLIELNLSSQAAGAVMTVSSSAFADKVLADGVSGDDHDLGSTFVASGTPITFQMTSDASGTNDTSLRITSFTVEAVPIPEPSALIFTLLGSSMLVFSRRRR